MLWLSGLERDEHARSNPWSETGDPKGCLHTTEGGGWPTYEGWSIMPHGTIMPIPGKGIRGKQHLPFDQGSFSLRNLAGGVQTNRDYVFQFELIGTCEKGGAAYRAGAYYWPDADDAVLADLYRKVIKPLSDAYGIPLRCQPWQAYPASYGARGITNTVRMSGTAFDNWSGWLGHQHVPENVHGDPGAFPWSRMIAAAEETDDMDEKATRALLIDVLKNERFIPNTTQDGDVLSYMSVGRALELIDYGKDRVNVQNAAEVARDTAAAAKLDALLGAVTALAAGSSDGITAAFRDGLAAFDSAVDQKLAAINVHLTVAGGTPPVQP